MSKLLHRFDSASTFRIALACVFVSVLAPSLASADIYTWTDERGTTVISDTPPGNPKRVTDLQVVVRDSDRRSGKRSGAREATPTEQKLLDRIENLERQAKAQTYSAPPAAAPQPPAAVSYYTTPPAPPAYDPYYYDAYPAYAPSYYPGYYPPSYSYIVPGAVVVRRPFVSRGFVGPRGFSHHHHGGGGFVHRGRR